MRPDKLIEAINVELQGRGLGPLTPQQQDFMACLVSSLVAAVPCFLEAFITCITGDGSSPGNYNPGTRQRCPS